MLKFEDVKAGVATGRTNADLVESGRWDTLSLQTMAAVMMVFLPLLFFAALFAVPSLDWDEPLNAVMNENFWVYGAAAVPVTVLVLAIWGYQAYRLGEKSRRS